MEKFMMHRNSLFNFFKRLSMTSKLVVQGPEEQNRHLRQFLLTNKLMIEGLLYKNPTNYPNSPQMPLSRLPSLFHHHRHLLHHPHQLPLSPLIAMAASSTISSSSSTDPIISPSTTRVGWIGTGVMGSAMAGHLLSAGYSLSVFNRTVSKAQSLVSRGARLSPSVSSLAASSDVVFLIVGFPSDVRGLILGPAKGLLPHLSPGAVLVDMTTSDPSLARDISSAASSAGVHSIDAPVSGGDVGARNASLSIFAGGDETVVRRLSPLFNLMGKVNYMGGPGLGQYAKLGNQIAIASTMVGLVEGMVYAHKAGLDVERWVEAISKGAARSRSLELYGKRILERDMAAGFYVKHFVKDLGICLKECERMGLALPGLALAQQLYLSLVANGEEGLGTQALVLAVERLNNVHLTKKKREEEGKSG